MSPRPSVEEEARLLCAGTEEVLPEGELARRLEQSRREGRPLRVKQGFDPTAPDIHLGHTVGLRKLRQFQELGHQVVLIVGDYTGQVGDPSGRSRERPQLALAEVEANARTYLEQFYRVLERDPAPPRLPVEVHRNGEWFAPMDFMGVMRLGAQYTVARLLEREDFSKRFAAGHPIHVHELFYPLMQGHDSVEIRSDVELGATEQKFNLIVGRALQELHGQPPQIVMTLPVLPGLDGVQRMSKSTGNYVGVSEAPEQIFGKLMSLPDEVLPLYFRLVVDVPEAERERIGRETALIEGRGLPEAELAGRGLSPEAVRAYNPMALKKWLAHRVVVMYHGSEAADRAQRAFEVQFQEGGTPDTIPSWRAPDQSEIGIKDLLVAAGLAASGSAAWRAVDQGAVGVDGVRITDRGHKQRLDVPFVLRLGRKMVRVEPGSRSSEVTEDR